LAVKSALASFTSGGHGAAALVIAGDTSMTAAATSTTRFLIVTSVLVSVR